MYLYSFHVWWNLSRIAESLDSPINTLTIFFLPLSFFFCLPLMGDVFTRFMFAVTSVWGSSRLRSCLKNIRKSTLTLLLFFVYSSGGRFSFSLHRCFKILLCKLLTGDLQSLQIPIQILRFCCLLGAHILPHTHQDNLIQSHLICKKKKDDLCLWTTCLPSFMSRTAPTSQSGAEGGGG